MVALASIVLHELAMDCQSAYREVGTGFRKNARKIKKLKLRRRNAP